MYYLTMEDMVFYACNQTDPTWMYRSYFILFSLVPIDNSVNSANSFAFFVKCVTICRTNTTKSLLLLFYDRHWNCALFRLHAWAKIETYLHKCTRIWCWLHHWIHLFHWILYFESPKSVVKYYISLCKWVNICHTMAFHQHMNTFESPCSFFRLLSYWKK